MAKTKKHPKPKPSRRILGYLSNYDGAHGSLVGKGGKDPADWEEIETDYDAAREALLDYVASLEAKIKDLEANKRETDR